MAHSFPIGISEFSEIREKQLFYVDKSGLIGELLGDPAKALLLPRPRRFGKTLNLTMLRCFFEDGVDNRKHFEGLAIAHDQSAMEHLGRYPTIYLSFKDLKSPHWPECQERLIHLLQQLVGQHWSRIEQANLPDHAKAPLQRLLTAPTLAACKDSLSLLTALLYRSSGRRVVLLIDEYDTPIHAGYAHGYREQIVDFMRDLLSGGLKDNPALEKGVLTGILRLAKDSIFSGLNNLQVSTLLDEAYSSHFGFTEAEVHELLREAGLSQHEDSIRRWYNGYRFGSQTLYNPWSILSMLRAPDTPFRAHWVNTASNELIRDLVVNEHAISLAELSALLAGEAVVREVDPYVGLTELKPENVWSLLLFSGYLTVRDPLDTPTRMALCIPNQEVRQFFETTLNHWLGSPKHTDELLASLLAEDLTRFSLLLAETVNQVLSYHDTAGTDNERVYHVFLAGLLVRLRDSHEILSNREAGFGRFDLALLPRQGGGSGFIFELKHGEAKQLPKLAAEALNQILTNNYPSALRARGVTRIILIGLAFDGKRVHLESKIWTPTGLQTLSPTTTPNEEATIAQLAKRIQEKQRLMGLTATPLAALLSQDRDTLDAIAQALGLD